MSEVKSFVCIAQQELVAQSVVHFTARATVQFHVQCTRAGKESFVKFTARIIRIASRTVRYHSFIQCTTYLSLFFSQRKKAYEFTFLSVFSHPSTFEQVNRFVWNSVRRSYHVRSPRRHNFNPLASTFPKWRTFRLLSWTQNLNQSTQDHEILYADKSSKDWQLLMGPCLWETKDRTWRSVEI
jgi:hypothetical protein